MIAPLITLRSPAERVSPRGAILLAGGVASRAGNETPLSSTTAIDTWGRWAERRSHL
jgi:hypothetical protein